MNGAGDSNKPGEHLDWVLDSDARSFALFVRRHERRVAAIAARLCDDPRDVAEITQDTFVHIWHNASQFRYESSVETWIYRIAVHTALMRLRRKRLPQISLERARTIAAAGAADLTAEEAARRDRIAAVRAALRTLPADQRAAVVLRDIEGLSAAEAAAVLQVTEANLKSRLHRGRMRMRAKLSRLS